MIGLEICRKVSLSFPEVSEQPHFDKASFRVAKKIFATLDEAKLLLNIKLSLIDQDVFSKFAPDIIYPVPNKWGKQGWTVCRLQHINPDIFNDAITAAYIEVAPKKLSALLKLSDG